MLDRIISFLVALELSQLKLYLTFSSGRKFLCHS
jgi:hypothetical protein